MSGFNFLFSPFSICGFSKNCFVHKLWRHLLTVSLTIDIIPQTDSGSIAATPALFFPTAEGCKCIEFGSSESVCARVPEGYESVTYTPT